MKKSTKIFSSLILIFTPTMQMSATQSEAEKFKQDLLIEIQKEIKDLSPAEIRQIIDQVEKDLAWDNRPKSELVTKEELYLKQHKNEVSLQTLNSLKHKTKRPEQELIFEELNPRLKMMPEKSYRYNNRTKELEFQITKDELFHGRKDSMVQATAWAGLRKGDVLINFDNGTSSFKWGHTGLMYRKTDQPASSKTIEAPGDPNKVMLVDYNEVWHSNTRNRMTYNSVPRIAYTKKPAYAADNATLYLNRPYGIFHPLGQANEIYCTELVFLAYKSQGVNLGNGLDTGSWWILTPNRMYCDDDLLPYFKQKVGGGMC